MSSNCNTGIKTKLKNIFCGCYNRKCDSELAEIYSSNEAPEFPVISVYFASWSIYSRNFRLSDVDGSRITHLIYAFAKISENFEIVFDDEWAALESPHPHTGERGFVGEMASFRKKHPHIKIGLSIGGANSRPQFIPMATSATQQHSTIQSAVALMRRCDFDFMDVDWEFPSGIREMLQFVDFVRRLDGAIKQNKSPGGFVTVALPASTSLLCDFYLTKIGKIAKIVHLMTYCYSLCADAHASNDASLESSSVNGECVRRSVEFAVRRGVPRPKLVIGIPAFCRTFGGCRSVGMEFEGAGSPGRHDSAFWDYAEVVEHRKELFTPPNASYSLLKAQETLVMHETASTIAAKMAFVKEAGLAGAFIWHIAQNAPGDDSLLTAVHQELVSQ